MTPLKKKHWQIELNYSQRSEMGWSKEQKVFVIGAYFRCNSYQDAQTQFRQKYPEERRNFPHVNTIKYWMKCFRKDAYVPTLSRPRQKLPTIRTPENISTVRDSVDDDGARVGPPFPWPDPSGLFPLGLLKGKIVPKQSSNNRWTERCSEGTSSFD